ncbi:hypothetical protein Cni_G14995 [Canna indica]|uniref:Uncharacterized protein n=1 Tax=Canna indica TaxID=4628 RepID=A0AAQ3KG24_9LILI|nr:hypothetical protein Cni_G14995 [Canna indica]
MRESAADRAGEERAEAALLLPHLPVRLPRQQEVLVDLRERTKLYFASFAQIVRKEHIVRKEAPPIFDSAEAKKNWPKTEDLFVMLQPTPYLQAALHNTFLSGPNAELF